MLRLLACLAALIFGGCSSSLGPDASIRLPNEARAQGPAVNMYWPCLIDVPAPDLLKERYSVEIDDKVVGDIARCEYRRFETTAGRHTIDVKSPMLLVDLAKAFNLKGPEYTVPPERPIYMRLSYYQYVEYQEVSADEGIRDIDIMAQR